MGLRFIRQPSDTPNVQIGDDVRAFRYAYGDQNGYIKGKGTECGYEVNGLNFIIKSGEIVISGYASEVDANGVTLTIDNIVTKRYYTVYYQVNLALFSVSILATYDTAGYPVINPGDDLNVNTVGTARMELYRFTATNGVISEVSKRVQPIKYFTDFAGLNIALRNGTYDNFTAGFAKQAENQTVLDNSSKIANTKFVKDVLLNHTGSSNITFSSVPGIGDKSGVVNRFYKLVTGSLSFSISPNVQINDHTTLATIPSNYRPSISTKVYGLVLNFDNNAKSKYSPQIISLTINTNGTVVNDYDILRPYTVADYPDSVVIVNFSYNK